jgi:hypothetical protein
LPPPQEARMSHSLELRKQCHWRAPGLYKNVSLVSFHRLWYICYCYRIACSLHIRGLYEPLKMPACQPHRLSTGRTVLIAE